MADAVDAGYRLFDTACVYGNEEQVGEAVSECGVPREELFLTTGVEPVCGREEGFFC